MGSFDCKQTALLVKDITEGKNPGMKGHPHLPQYIVFALNMIQFMRALFMVVRISTTLIFFVHEEKMI